jgi:hypothetical protein
MLKVKKIFFKKCLEDLTSYFNKTFKDFFDEIIDTISSCQLFSDTFFEEYILKLLTIIL